MEQFFFVEQAENLRLDNTYNNSLCINFIFIFWINEILILKNTIINK